MRILAALLLALPAFGTPVVTTLGIPTFADGATPNGPTFTGAADVSPFNIVHGEDNGVNNADFSFTFNYTPTTGITSASILLALYDVDSAASGNQIGLFTLNNTVNLTSALNALSEAAQGAQSEITYLNLTLPPAAFAQLETGTATFRVVFSAPSLTVLGEGTSNAGGIDFARLTFDTETVEAIPEPSSFLLAAGGGLALLLRKRFFTGK